MAKSETSDMSIPAEPRDPQKKGGGDGNAKSAAPKTRPAKARGETNSSDAAAEPALKSRKITRSRG
jgi:hypothetical protein